MVSIDNEDDLRRALDELVRLDDRFSTLPRVHGMPALRRAPEGLACLLRIVTEQLISLAAAEAIWRRLETRLVPLSADTIVACGEFELRRLGLSGAKARTFLAVAKAERHGSYLAPGFLAQLHDDAARSHLTRVPGIGPWSAEIYLLSALGRSDAWPAGDIALRTAAWDLFRLPERPDGRMMTALAEPWRPWRSVAARLLWNHYRAIKGMPLENISSSQDRHTIYSKFSGNEPMR